MSTNKTNYDHYKEELLATEMTTGNSCDFIQEKILKKKCSSEFSCDQCKMLVVDWLKQPYEEPKIEIDWKRVPVDTPVYVNNGVGNPSEKGVPRYFKEFKEGYEEQFVTYSNGATSFSGASQIGCAWKCCSLARPEDVEKYRK